MMGSGAETAHELVDWMVARGEKVGVLKVRLYRPFAVEDFLHALPETARAIAVLDRTKEPGAIGDPLYLDVIAALRSAENEGAQRPRASVVGGRYGLSSKEFTPAMVRAVFDELANEKPRRRFTVGIVDDVTGLSLPVDSQFDIEPQDVVRAVFYGLGADGTVGANKNSIKIIGEETDQYAQGYFVYDSKKSGAITISHLRFGPRPIQSSYLIRRASFVAVHQWNFFERYDVLEMATPGGTLLVNSQFAPDQLWDELPREVQERIIELGLKVYTVDALDVAHRAGMGGRINTVMQTCFFALAKIFPREEAIGYIKRQIKKTYGAKGEDVVNRNYAVVDDSLAHLHEIKVPQTASSRIELPPIVSERAPDFVKRVTAVILAGKGDSLPVSAFPIDGTWPTATSKWEKRNLALEIPVWDPLICTQCNKCAMVCPHAAIRVKVYPAAALAGAPATFKSTEFKATYCQGDSYSVQVAPEDCTGCTLCVEVCPAKDKKNPRHKAIDMVAQAPLRAAERDNYEFFLALPEVDRTQVPLDVKGTQFFEPLFEYSGACSGCGETPYIKLLTQVFGDRALIANATGCSSIYGGNLPTTPYAVNPEGRGPAWSNSLFEDNAEFGFGYRLAVDQHAKQAQQLLRALAGEVGGTLVDAAARRRAARRGRDPGAARARRGLARQAQGQHPARGEAPRTARRLPGPQERLDRGRRRLGLRHRLRRPGPRPRLGARREHPRARHRGLFQHRRPAVQGHADRRGGEVRRGGQVDREEGPRHAGHGLRRRLRGTGRLRLAGRADRQGFHRGRRLPGAFADHRLFALHRARLRSGEGHRAAEARRRHRLLAAVPLRSAQPRPGPEPAASGFARCQGQGDRLHAQRNALPHGRATGSGAIQGTDGPVAEQVRRAARAVLAHGAPRRCRARGPGESSTPRKQGRVIP